MANTPERNEMDERWNCAVMVWSVKVTYQNGFGMRPLEQLYIYYIGISTIVSKTFIGLWTRKLLDLIVGWVIWW